MRIIIFHLLFIRASELIPLIRLQFNFLLFNKYKENLKETMKHLTKDL